jgi:hypothetical protein
MLSRATGLFSIYRGTTTNSSGDLTEDNTTAVSEDAPWPDDEPWVPMQAWNSYSVTIALHNQSVVEDNPNTATARVVTAIRGRATRGTDLRVQDRIKDQATGIFYVIDTVIAPLSSTRNSDLGFSCHRVN